MRVGYGKHKANFGFVNEISVVLHDDLIIVNISNASRFPVMADAALQ